VFAIPGLAAGSPTLDSQGLQGRVTVLAFWASWCVPCRSELPRLARAVAGRDVALVAVNTNDTRSEATGFLASAHLRLRSGFDDQGRVAEAFQLPGLPATVVLTASGLVSARYVGPVSAHTLTTALRQAGKR
jgi:cytochrome c biogenesis protein CcmG/thiol:disulfide interchange protein DsbE